MEESSKLDHGGEASGDDQDGEQESSEDDEPAVNFRLDDEIDAQQVPEKDEDDMDEDQANEAAGIPQGRMLTSP